MRIHYLKLHNVSHSLSFECFLLLFKELLHINCELCRFYRLGDEYHYVVECNYFDDLREIYLPRVLFFAPNTVTFQMNSSKIDTELKDIEKSHAYKVTTCMRIIKMLLI